MNNAKKKWRPWREDQLGGEELAEGEARGRWWTTMRRGTGGGEDHDEKRNRRRRRLR